jgi:diadenosine tetraphosphate (Ap4A) HIT family hydrolase
VNGGEPRPAESAGAAACNYCAVERDTPEEEWLYRDPLWSVAGHTLLDEPGWAIVMLRRHVERIGELTAEELQSLGPMAARMSEAISSVTAAEKVYVVLFLETNHHFHLLLTPREADAPPSLRGPALLVNRRQYKDATAAVQVGDRIREYLARTSTPLGAH